MSNTTHHIPSSNEPHRSNPLCLRKNSRSHRSSNLATSSNNSALNPYSIILSGNSRSAASLSTTTPFIRSISGGPEKLCRRLAPFVCTISAFFPPTSRSRIRALCSYAKNDCAAILSRCILPRFGELRECHHSTSVRCFQSFSRASAEAKWLRGARAKLSSSR